MNTYTAKKGKTNCVSVRNWNCYQTDFFLQYISVSTQIYSRLQKKKINGFTYTYIPKQLFFPQCKVLRLVTWELNDFFYPKISFQKAFGISTKICTFFSYPVCIN